MRNYYVALLLMFCSLPALCQLQEGGLEGKITSVGEAVPFATITLKETQFGTSADDKGQFRLHPVPAGQYTLLVSAVGFTAYETPVTIDGQVIRKNIHLQSATKQLEEVVVTGTMKETYLSKSPVKVEVINAKFLQKTPASSMMESIEIVNGVQPQVMCGVCGTNELRINGMQGPYSLILIDGMPIMGALSSVYGLNGIPTSLINRLEVIKGPSSTLYGTEAVAGVINVITKSPASMPLLSVNAFGTSQLEKNVDFAVAPKLKKAEVVFSGNYFGMNNFLDANDDNFADAPLVQRVSLFNKWNFKRKHNRTFQVSGRYYYEDRFGGVSEWNTSFRGSGKVYGESIYTNRTELIGTYQLPIEKEKIRVDFSFNRHQQNSAYGATVYNADQSIYFANLLWDKELGPRNSFLLGTTFRYQTYDDNTQATTQADKRFIPGIFVQNEFSATEKLTLLGGLRWDHHRDHGNIFSPRFNIKYDLTDHTTARLNAGTGFRIVNLFTEDHAALTGARQVVITDHLKPETSYSTALNINHIAEFNGNSMMLDVDAFYTYFTNQIIPDYRNEQTISYGNLKGHAITRGIAVNASQTFTFPLTVSLGATYQDVFRKEENAEGTEVKIPVLHTPAFSGVFAISYDFKRFRTTIDYTGRAMGPMHLPTYAPPFERPTKSEWYSVQNVQITHNITSKLAIYWGAKNILNYTQASPLINPAQPFSATFDTAYVYGPLQTRRWLVGVRWSL